MKIQKCLSFFLAFSAIFFIPEKLFAASSSLNKIQAVGQEADNPKDKLFKEISNASEQKVPGKASREEENKETPHSHAAQTASDLMPFFNKPAIREKGPQDYPFQQEYFYFLLFTQMQESLREVLDSESRVSYPSFILFPFVNTHMNMQTLKEDTLACLFSQDKQETALQNFSFRVFYCENILTAVYSEAIKNAVQTLDSYSLEDPEMSPYFLSAFIYDRICSQMQESGLDKKFISFLINISLFRLDEKKEVEKLTTCLFKEENIKAGQDFSKEQQNCINAYLEKLYTETVKTYYEFQNMQGNNPFSSDKEIQEELREENTPADISASEKGAEQIQISDLGEEKAPALSYETVLEEDLIEDKETQMRGEAVFLKDYGIFKEIVPVTFSVKEEFHLMPENDLKALGTTIVFENADMDEVKKQAYACYIRLAEERKRESQSGEGKNTVLKIPCREGIMDFVSEEIDNVAEDKAKSIHFLKMGNAFQEVDKDVFSKLKKEYPRLPDETLVLLMDRAKLSLSYTQILKQINTCLDEVKKQSVNERDLGEESQLIETKPFSFQEMKCFSSYTEILLQETKRQVNRWNR